MATDPGFMNYLLDDQLRGHFGARVRAHRMFGEYALYLDDKVVALVCDNQVFLKPTEAVRAALGEALRPGHPYPGSKPWWQLGTEVEDRERLVELITLTATALPLPRPKPAPGAKKVPAKKAAAKNAAAKKPAARKPAAKKAVARKKAVS